MFSRKKGGVKILPAKMSVWLSHTLLYLEETKFKVFLKISGT